MKQQAKGTGMVEYICPPPAPSISENSCFYSNTATELLLNYYRSRGKTEELRDRARLGAPLRLLKKKKKKKGASKRSCEAIPGHPGI